MSKYEFKAINLIAEAFEKHEAKFRVFNMQGQEELVAGFSVDGGPNVMMKFIIRDNDNDVAARIFGLITKIPKEKRARVMEACNVLNRKIRFMKFYLDTDGDINVEYDFPVHSSDDCIGEMAFEIFVRTMHILDNEYEVFMKALYTEEELDVREPRLPSELRELLEGLRGDPDLPSGLRSLLDGLEEDGTDESSEDSEEVDDESCKDGIGVNGATKGTDTDSVDGQESFAAFLRMVSADMGADSNNAEDIA